MKRYFGGAVSLALAAALCWLATSSTSAQPPNKAGDRPVGPEHAGVQLTAEQMSQVRALVAAAGEKYAELERRAGQVVPAGQRGAAEAAKKAAKATGRKGPAEHAFVDALASYSEKQRADLTALDEERKAIEDNLRSEIEKLLTGEQRAALPPPKGPPHKGPHEKGHPKEHEPKAKGPHPKHDGPRPKSDDGDKAGDGGPPHDPPHVVLERLEQKLDQLLQSRSGK